MLEWILKVLNGVQTKAKRTEHKFICTYQEPLSQEEKWSQTPARRVVINDRTRVQGLFRALFYL